MMDHSVAQARQVTKELSRVACYGMTISTSALFALAFYKGFDNAGMLALLLAAAFSVLLAIFRTVATEARQTH